MSYQTKSIATRWVTALLAAAALVLTGCKTVPADTLTSFTSGITSARTQSQEAFNAVNELVADASLDYAASQTNLVESSFTAGLDEESLAAWDQVLEKLEKYAQHLQLLTSPDLAKSFDDEAVNLSAELNNFGQHLQGSGLINKSPQISPAIATGFTKLGELIVRLRAQTRARKVLVATDAEIGRIFRTMADSVGTSRTNEIRGTVTAHWTQFLAEKKVAFRNQPDLAGKRQIAADFLQLLERRVAQDLVLLSLRRSLLQLAELHHALAQGERWTAQSAAAAIADEIKRTRDLNDRFKDKLKNQ
ncbi:MAG TPA: hypothetical protein VN887_10380 [Candidatus Angelobacter sp.]|nr:hypothetical protein [Candidatus Angelobacter sp.]